MTKGKQSKRGTHGQMSVHDHYVLTYSAERLSNCTLSSTHVKTLWIVNFHMNLKTQTLAAIFLCLSQNVNLKGTVRLLMLYMSTILVVHSDIFTGGNWCT